MLKKFKSLKQSLTKTFTENAPINESVWNNYRDRALAESAGLDVKTPSVEQIAKKHETSVDAIEAQLKKGIAVEAEHTTDPSKAREIALDHLGEIPDYYDRLGKMERSALHESKDIHGRHIVDDDVARQGAEHAEHLHQMTRHHEYLMNRRVDLELSRKKSDKKLLPAARAAESEASKPAQQAIKTSRAFEQKHGVHPVQAWEAHHGQTWPHYRVNTSSAGSTHVKKSAAVLSESSAQKEFQKHYKLFNHYDRLAYPAPQKIVHKHLQDRNYHEKEMNRHYTNMTPKEKNQSRLYESGDAPYKVGDQVIAKEGPHKGALHTVIHVHDTGHVNIKPVHSRGRQNRYPLGAARAHPDQITRAPLQEDLKEIRRAISQKQGEHTQLAHLHGDTHPKTKKALKELGVLLGQQEDHYMKKWDDKLAARAAKKTMKESSELTEASKRSHYADKQERDPAKWVKNREKLFKHPEGLSNFGKKIKQKDPFDPFKMKKGISYKHVQEAFQAAIAKKNGTTGDQDPGQAEVSAAAPQPEKKDNRPTPPKNSKKVEVKGPGPDDKFQPESIVTPLTTLPNQTPGIRS